MSTTRSGSARPDRSLPARIVLAARSLDSSRRLAATASLGLFLTMFLPWYQETAVVDGKPVAASVDAWGAFSFVEAAVLLVAVGVLVLLFARAESRAFHLPGGDGWIVTIAGAWTCVLIVWRIFDKSAAITSVTKATVGVTGIEWGIGFALGAAALLTYAGTRMRAANRPEPPLPGEGDRAYREPRARSASARRARSEPEPATAATTTMPGGAPAASRSIPPAPRAEPPRPAQPARDEPGQRSSWRPADRPEWTDQGFEQDRPVGWLTRPRGASGQDREPGDGGPEADDGPPPDQLTIPFDER